MAYFHQVYLGGTKTAESNAKHLIFMHTVEMEFIENRRNDSLSAPIYAVELKFNFYGITIWNNGKPFNQHNVLCSSSKCLCKA